MIRYAGFCGGCFIHTFIIALMLINVNSAYASVTYHLAHICRCNREKRLYHEMQENPTFVPTKAWKSVLSCGEKAKTGVMMGKFFSKIDI